MKYKMISYQIQTDQGLQWVAEYPALPGVLGTDPDLFDAITDLENNAKAHLQFLKELGKPIPPEDALVIEKHYSGKILVRVPKSIHKMLFELSETEGVSLNSVIKDAISRYIGSQIPSR
jgi:predicted RNase H-like HicB family nuclease